MKKLIAVSILIFLVSILATTVSAGLENNGGFESWPDMQSDGFVPGAYIDVDNPLQWAWFSDNGNDVRRNRENFTKRSGTYSIKMAAPYNNTSGQNTGFYQFINAIDGATYRLQMYAAGFPNYTCGNPVIAYKIGSQSVVGIQLLVPLDKNFYQKSVDIVVNDPNVPTGGTTTLYYYALMHVNCPNSTNPGDVYFDDYTVTKIADPPTPTPSAPTSLQASCPSPGTTATVSWTNGSSATTHNVRINNTANGWNGSCTSPNSGDFCFNSASSPRSFSSTAGATYSWWVDACNSSGCTTAPGPNFTCTTAGQPNVTCSVNKTTAQLNEQVAWTATVIGGTQPYTYTWSGTDSLNSKTSTSPNRTDSQTVSYSTAGTKTGAVSVTDSTGASVGPISCTNSVTITAPAPTVSLTADPKSIANNASSTLSWTTTSCTTTNSCSCSASGDWSGSKSISGGSQSTGNLTGPANYTYTLTCRNSNGTSLRSTANVSVSGVSGAICTPETDAAFCSRLGKNCGTVSGTDNCGGTRTVTSCGTCSGSQTCGGGGTPNVCGGGSCTAETDAAFCSRLGKNCGSVTASDNCGTIKTVSCGTTCPSGQTCGGGGTPNVCGGSSSLSGTSPWIQTTGGDVHSNTNINTPGGP